MYPENLLKIGMTTRTPEERAREIYENHIGLYFKTIVGAYMKGSNANIYQYKVSSWQRIN